MLIEAARFDTSPNLVDLKELSDLVRKYPSRVRDATRINLIARMCI